VLGKRTYIVQVAAEEVSVKKPARIAISLAVILLLALGSGVLYLTFGHSRIRLKFSARPSAPSNSPDRLVLTSPGDFAYHTLEGKEQHLLADKGKVIFVNRWGTWCAPCVAEMPSIQNLYDRYKTDPDVKFLIIASGDSASDVQTFALHHHLDLPFYVEEEADTPDLDFSTFPTTSIYGKDGTLVSKRVGGADWSAPAVIAQIEQLKLQTGQQLK
jgi:thiol-disulfide isomerase/thioredoxin